MQEYLSRRIEKVSGLTYLTSQHRGMAHVPYLYNWVDDSKELFICTTLMSLDQMIAQLTFIKYGNLRNETILLE